MTRQTVITEKDVVKDEMPEQRVARRGLAYYEAAIRNAGGKFERRNELIVKIGPRRIKLPDATYKIFPDPEDSKRCYYSIVMAKASPFNKKVLDDCVFWLGKAHEVWALVESGNHVADCIEAGYAAGIMGMIEVGEDTIRIERWTDANFDADCGPVAESFEKQPANFDVRAGSAGVRRCTEPRGEFHRDILPKILEHGERFGRGKVRIDAGELRKKLQGTGTKPYTVAAQRKKVDSGDWHATYENHAKGAWIIVDARNRG